MRYPLLSRFQGALLGASLGAALGNFWQAQLQQHPRPGPLPLPPVPLDPNSGFNQILQQSCDCLIYAGTETRGDRQSMSALPLGNPLHLMAAAVPIALFCHQQPHQLQQQLLALMAASPTPQKSQAEIMALAIAAVLQEQIPLEGLIDYVLLNLADPDDLTVDLTRQLHQVQSWLRARTGFAPAVPSIRTLQSEPGLGPAALALGCFLSTPEDFSLILCRAARCHSQTPFTVAIAGALAGVYNSRAGIPPRWQLCSPQLTQTSLHLAAQLLAAWSGVYGIYSRKNTALPVAVSAPGVLRPR